ncbi:hypothetical protein [Flavobacterium sp.]|uniref:hypothetical protein n=1 Tax=Flavobacterium sp. TaxID=239 RepID=UPI002FD92F2B
MKNLLFILFFYTSFAYSQKTFINTRDSIYMNKELFYTTNNNTLFDGYFDRVKKNGVIISREVYENGILKKILFYYNKSAKGKVYLEIQYSLESSNYYKKKEIYYHSNGEIYKVKDFDLVNLANLVLYENGTIVYSCEYKNGKKHGIEICYDKNNNLIQFQYENGKKIIK